MQYRHLQNHTIITCHTYSIMAFKFEGKEMNPIFVFAKCWLMHSLVAMLSKNANSKERKATPTQTLQFHVKFMYMPCWFSIYIVYFFNIWFGMVQHQKQLGCREGRKID